MGAIAGIVRSDARPLAEASLEAMLAALTHRGAVSSGCWTDGLAGLGARANRFGQTLGATNDPHGFSGNTVASSGRMVAVADARIDNRDELISILRLPNLPDSEISDTHLILAAYEKWGDECPEKILGDFAFAVWDGERRRLFCACDPFGLRPFFFHQDPHLFAFASEIKGLFAAPEVPRRVDETRVLQYLAGYFEDQERTFYENIRKLAPAHSLTIDAGGLSTRRYWSPDPARELRLGSDQEYAEAFRSIFQESVRCRIKGVSELGSTLSGGLDSSSIACMARTIRAGSHAPLHTFSLIFDDVPHSDERRYMDAVVRGGGVTPHYVHGDRIGPLFDIERSLRTHDEPVFTPNMFLHAAMYRAARDAGVAVLLDGLDGDTTVSHGVSRLPELAGAGRWATLGRELQAIRKRADSFSGTAALKNCVTPWIPDRLGLQRRDTFRREARRSALGAMLNPDFRKRSMLDERLDDFFTPRRRAPRTEREEHFRRLGSGLISSAMQAGDRESAFHGVEARYPFFDRRLIEFCLSLPADQKLRDGWTRWIMRQGMDGVLPPEIQWRWGKGDLGHNFLHTFQAFDRERLRDALIDNGDRLAPYLQSTAVQTCFDRLEREQTWDAAAPVLRMTILSLWLGQNEAAGS